jgi:hypothetical protein
MVIVVRKYHRLPHHYHIPYIFMFITNHTPLQNGCLNLTLASFGHDYFRFAPPTN